MQDQVLHKPRHSEEFQKARQQSNTRQGSLCSAYFLAPWFTLAAIMCWEQPEKNCRRCKSQHQLLVLINAYSCVKLSARFDQISLTEASWWWQNCESTEFSWICRWSELHQFSHWSRLLLFPFLTSCEVSFLWNLLKACQCDQLNNGCSGKTHWISTDSCGTRSILNG